MESCSCVARLKIVKPASELCPTLRPQIPKNATYIFLPFPINFDILVNNTDLYFADNYFSHGNMNASFAVLLFWNNLVT